MRQVTISFSEEAAAILDTIARGKKSSYLSQLVVNTWTTPKQRIIAQLNQAVENARKEGLDVTYDIRAEEKS